MGKHPLVSVMIPTYNRPYYLELALQSVLNQTYPNIEIIVSDDSTNHDTAHLIASYKQMYPRITYVKNEQPMGVANLQQCLSLASGKYVSFLADDDLFHPQNIDRMVRCFLFDPSIKLVTSYRQTIDEHGHHIPGFLATRQLFQTPVILEGRELAGFVLKYCTNFIGEPSTVMFRKKDLSEPFGVYKGNQYHCLNDLATWISLLSKGKVAYLPDALSYFRMHQGQNQGRIDLLTSAVYEWLILIRDAASDGIFAKIEDIRIAFHHHLNQSHPIINRAMNENRHDLLAHHKTNDVLTYIDQVLTYECLFCNHTFKQFVPWGDIHDFPQIHFENWNKYTSICPVCSSVDRERMYKMFIAREPHLLSPHNSILHVAPEPNLRHWISGFPGIRYICGDMDPGNVPGIEYMDITGIRYPDDSFDFIICSHVLEHIPDDLRAMRELYRVMNRGGTGILQVPIALNLSETYENPSIVTPEDRQRVFGQSDHVRIYAKDYVKRLKSVGFFVEQINMAKAFGVFTAMKCGLSETDTLYIVRKV